MLVLGVLGFCASCGWIFYHNVMKEKKIKFSEARIVLSWRLGVRMGLGQLGSVISEVLSEPRVAIGWSW